MKKIIVVFVNNSMAELDWILPILYSLSKNHEIFTYFRNQKSYESLKQNFILFSLWRKISNFFYIEKSSHRLIFKIIQKFNILFKSENLNRYLNNKIVDTNIINKIIQNKIHTDKYKLKIIFSDFGENFLFLHLYKNIKKNRPLIVHYPHTPLAYEKNNKKKHKIKLVGDLLFLSRKNDITFFENSIQRKKIIPVGIPRFDKWWVDRNFLSYKNNLDIHYSLNELKKKFIITIAYDSKFGVKRFKDKIELFKKQLVDLMDIISKISNVLIIFKVHPRRNSKEFQDVLNKYDKNIWKISKMHLLQLASLSNCFICHQASGAGYEALNFKVPLIQIWPVVGVDVKKDINVKLGLVQPTKNKNELFKFIKLSKNKNNTLWKTQQKNFKINYPNLGFSTSKVLKILNKEQKKLNNL
tara:strand:- start:292 stop:1527 length:1236 start_codon:yes stop_codon:yes gene_type:complete